MIVKILMWLVIGCLSGWLYQKAGQGGFRGAKLLRRLGCNALALGYFVALQGSYGLKTAYILPYALSFGISMLALGTYWDFLTRLWRGDQSEYWENWLLTGAGYSLALLPLLWTGTVWHALLARTVILGLATMIFSEIISKARLEEFIRGFLLTSTLPLLLL